MRRQAERTGLGISWQTPAAPRNVRRGLGTRNRRHRVRKTSSPLLATFWGLLLLAPRNRWCLNSTLFHVEGFPGDGVFKGADARRLAKSTVRIRITHTRLAEELMERKRRDLRATTFHMGGFSPIAGMDEGICTGTLIAGNVVLTAGHCVSAHYWSVEKGVEFPYFQIGDARSYITERDFAKLLVVDFNYQIHLSPVASIDNLSPAPVRAALRFTVRELVSSAAESNGGLDYAILRIAGAPAQIVDYALGADKLKLYTFWPGRCHRRHSAPVRISQKNCGGHCRLQ